jgi:hypothetical protein
MHAVNGIWYILQMETITVCDTINDNSFAKLLKHFIFPKVPFLYLGFWSKLITDICWLALLPGFPIFRFLLRLMLWLNLLGMFGCLRFLHCFVYRHPPKPGIVAQSATRLFAANANNSACQKCNAESLTKNQSRNAVSFVISLCTGLWWRSANRFAIGRFTKLLIAIVLTQFANPFGNASILFATTRY